MQRVTFDEQEMLDKALKLNYRYARDNGYIHDQPSGYASTVEYHKDAAYVVLRNHGGHPENVLAVYKLIGEDRIRRVKNYPKDIQ